MLSYIVPISLFTMAIISLCMAILTRQKAGPVVPGLPVSAQRWGFALLYAGFAAACVGRAEQVLTGRDGITLHVIGVNIGGVLILIHVAFLLFHQVKVDVRNICRSTLKQLVCNHDGIAFVVERQRDGYHVVALSDGYAALYCTEPAAHYADMAVRDMYGDDGDRQFAKANDIVLATRVSVPVDEPVEAPNGVTGRYVGRKIPVLPPDGRKYVFSEGEHLSG